MQATQSWHSNNPAKGIGVGFLLAASRRFLRQTKMRSVLVEVFDVVAHQSLEMTFVEHDHMIEQIAAAASDEALGNTVLPWTLISL